MDFDLKENYEKNFGLAVNGTKIFYVISRWNLI